MDSDGPNASKIIFEGLVESQEARGGPTGAPRDATSTSAGDQHRVVFVRVLRSDRSEAAGTVRVLTGSGEGDCGFDFETGRQYLVNADRDDNENLVTSICTGTSLLEHADLALRALRGEQPTPDDLLDGEAYDKKFAPLWTGTVCGRVTKADGTPFGQAWVDMTQVRDEPFAVNAAADSDRSKADGSFCIRYIRPGKYVLTAERLDVKEYVGWAGYYPGGCATLFASQDDRNSWRGQPSGLAIQPRQSTCPLGAVRHSQCRWKPAAFGKARSVGRRARTRCTGLPSDADQKHRW